MHPDDIAARLDELEALCRQRGMPLTVQRRVILEAVLARDDHPTADQVLEAVRPGLPAISRTTVYRVLDTLAELGVIRRLQHSGTAVRYDGKVSRHHHLVCRHCHAVIDLENERLDKIRPPDDGLEGFAIEDFSVHFQGVCAACRRKTC